MVNYNGIEDALSFFKPLSARVTEVATERFL